MLASPALIKQSDLTDLVENHKVKKIIVLQAKDDILYEVESGYSLFSPINSDKNKNKIVVKTFEAGELNQHYRDSIDTTPNTFEYEILIGLSFKDIKLTMNRKNVHNDLRRMMIEMFPNLNKVIQYKGDK